MNCCNKNTNAGKVAKWTTPTIRFKPTLCEVPEIEKVFVVVRQSGKDVLEKDITEAHIEADAFAWPLSQEETSALAQGIGFFVQVDYITTGGIRYTTAPKQFFTVGSAINEVI